MAKDIEASGPLGEQGPPSPRARRGLWRSVVFPVLVIAAIAAAIWWLEYRDDDGDVSPSGERYGPVALPAGLAPPGARVAPEEDAYAPNFLLAGPDGQELRLSDFRGQPLVLNFWATWCAPCRKEIPQFVALYERYRGQGLTVIAVNLQESKSIVRSYAGDFGMEFPVVIDKRGSVGDRYRLLGLPTTFFIDREGVVRSVFTGPFVERSRGTNVQGAIGEGDLEERVAEILE